MQVILQKDYPQLGFIGEQVVVKSGFARNFLIPQGIALEINKRNEKFYRNKLQQIQSKKQGLLTTAQEVGEKLQAETFEFKLKVGAKGKSYGSITSRDIHKTVTDKGFELDRNQILLSEPIKKAGEFRFQAKLHSDVVVDVSAQVFAEIMKMTAAEKAIEEAEAADRAEKAAAEAEAALLAEDADGSEDVDGSSSEGDSEEQAASDSEDTASSEE